MKKILILIACVLVICTGLFFARESKKRVPLEEIPCAFCNANVLERQVFYEDHLVYALYTHRPIHPGHCLIIPKRHACYFHELKQEEVAQMALVTQRVHHVVKGLNHNSSYILLQKNGLEAGQTVPHVHIHYIPRQPGSYSAWEFFAKMLWANLKTTLSQEEIHNQVRLLKEGMQAQNSGSFQVQSEAQG